MDEWEKKDKKPTPTMEYKPGQSQQQNQSQIYSTGQTQTGTQGSSVYDDEEDNTAVGASILSGKERREQQKQYKAQKEQQIEEMYTTLQQRRSQQQSLYGENSDTAKPNMPQYNAGSAGKQNTVKSSYINNNDKTRDLMTIYLKKLQQESVTNGYRAPAEKTAEYRKHNWYGRADKEKIRELFEWAEEHGLREEKSEKPSAQKPKKSTLEKVENQSVNLADSKKGKRKSVFEFLDGLTDNIGPNAETAKAVKLEGKETADLVAGAQGKAAVKPAKMHVSKDGIWQLPEETERQKLEKHLWQLYGQKGEKGVQERHSLAPDASVFDTSAQQREIIETEKRLQELDKKEKRACMTMI